METLIALIAFLLCVVAPTALVVALIVWAVRRAAGGAPAVPLAASSTTRAPLDEFEQLIRKWVVQGRLASDVGAAVQALLAEERLAREQPVAPLVVPTQPPIERAPAVIPTTDLTPTHVATEALAAPVPAAPREPWAERMWDALLSLRTRQTLLFLGAFLLVVSALVLVVFNWASFPPILQFALLASVCGGLWGGGAWLARQSGLERAGAGLQAVGGVLVPVVAFSLSRPGLLDLAPRGAWLLASALSLPIYALAAWRTRQPLFAVAGCLSGASAVLAALSRGESQWLPLALAGTLLCYQPLGIWLRRTAAELAVGPYWVAHAGLPTALLAAALMRSSGEMGALALAATLWAAAAFYLLAVWFERLPTWAWVAALLAPTALFASLGPTNALPNQWLPLALLLALAGYLPLAQWLRRRAPNLADAPFLAAHAGAPALLLTTLLLSMRGDTYATPAAIALWIGTPFYLLALWLDRRPAWGWAAAAMPPIALLTSLSALHAAPLWWGAAPALLALGYAGLALALDPRAGPYALPAYAGAGALGCAALGFTVSSWETARWTLPLLLLGSLAIVLACHRGRFAWLAEDERLTLATLGLALAGVLLPAWLLALLDLAALSDGQKGLALLPLAALYLAGAYGWPGRARRLYDSSLQALGVLLALGAGAATLLDRNTWVPGMTALTAIWVFQTLLRRHRVWAAMALGNLLLAAALLLTRLDIDVTFELLAGVGLAFAALYLLGGTLLRRTAWRCWTWPAIGWGALLAAGTLAAIAGGVADTGAAGWRHVATLLALAGLLALVGALWRAAWPGYVVATLLALATLLAATRGFFTAWQPAPGDNGYVLCGVTLGLALLGQGLRRIHPRYAYPYEIVGFTLLTLAPFPATADARHAALTWVAMALLYALAGWRYGLRWAAAPALLAADLALLNGSAWLSPAGREAGAGLLLLAAAWAQGLFGLRAHLGEIQSSEVTIDDRRSTTRLLSIVDRLSSTETAMGRHGAVSQSKDHLLALEPAYVVALLSGLGALALASSASDVLVTVAFGLAALLALLGTAQRREIAAWGALALLALGFGSLHSFLGVDPLWSMAWGVAEALALCLLGWTIEPRTTQRVGARRVNQEPDARDMISVLSSRSGTLWVVLGIWYRPLWLGPLLVGAMLTAALLSAATLSHSLPPLTFALATLGLLLATLAVRRRELLYAYAAGATLIGAGLCQLYDWGFRQPQWFVIPSGLYLLALAEGLRRFQGRRGLSQMLEAGAAMLLLGVTFGQSLRAAGLISQLYAAWLCGEALALLGYGTLRQLRVPFFGGAAFFVAGVLWLSVDPLMAANKWVLLGILGLLLVGAYVLLERRQEQLALAGRAWVERVSGWG